MKISGYTRIMPNVITWCPLWQGKIVKPGDRWMIRGPVEYVPPVEVEVVAEREAIPLDRNEGIYVRNMKTGNVRAVTGQT